MMTSLFRKFYGYIAFVFFLILGLFCILIGLNLIDSYVLTSLIELVYAESSLQIGLVAIGLAVICFSSLYMQLQSLRELRGRTIAFDNEDGQIKISLFAIEDYIKKISQGIPAIKEVKPKIITRKKGVDIEAKVVLYAGNNIPDVTEEVQSNIRKKVQKMLGIEEEIKVKLFVTSIANPESRKGKAAKGAAPEPDEEAAKAPFMGIEYPESLREKIPE